MNKDDLPSIAKEIRRDIITMVTRVKGCHIGSALSCVDILTALYFSVMNIDPNDATNQKRDRLIFSKGHAVSALLVTLAKKGFFPEERLKDYLVNGTPYIGHVNSYGIAGIEFSTGSLGHGLSVGLGMALAAKMNNEKNLVYVVMSDGECDEGSVWEAVLAARNFKLDNLVAIIDYNKIQSFGTVSEVMELEPFAQKWQSFGWHTLEIDGHNITNIIDVLSLLCHHNQKPTVIIAHTVKGRGVSFMENTIDWHYLSPKIDQYAKAMEELQ